MHVIQARNVNDAYTDGIWWFKALQNAGLEPKPSRYGEVLASPTPVTTVYRHPRERVLFNPTRDANPFFHFFESLWMLAGREDVAFLTQFNKRMEEFSDDGEVFHGAYGYRWRQHFDIDQLQLVVEELKLRPESRRAVLSIWDPRTDLLEEGKDVPCNTNVYFQIRNGTLDMMVCNRSNDAIWGAYGANAVHFSYLQEAVACALLIPVGKYYQTSFNFHVYINMPRFQEIWDNPGSYNMYADEVSPGPPLFSDGKLYAFTQALEEWLGNKDEPAGYYFIDRVAMPMWKLWNNRKEKTWKNHCGDIVASDWQLACQQWIERRGYKNDS